jgi:hypothetical protein
MTAPVASVTVPCSAPVAAVCAITYGMTSRKPTKTGTKDFVFIHSTFCEFCSTTARAQQCLQSIKREATHQTVTDVLQRDKTGRGELNGESG